MVSTPDAPNNNVLTGVALFGTNQGFASGYNGYPARPTLEVRPLALSLTGMTWSLSWPVDPSPTLAEEFEDVAGSSTSDVWMVGQQEATTPLSGDYDPLLEHWNGSKFRRGRGIRVTGGPDQSAVPTAESPFW